jgi:hypothetical protein
MSEIVHRAEERCRSLEKTLTQWQSKARKAEDSEQVVKYQFE